jgi:hypothetical protein
MSTQEAVALYNLALEELGQSPIDDFGDASPGAENAEARYTQTVGFLLGLRTWSFQKTVVQLSRLEAAPSTGYEYAFEIPGAQYVLSVFESLEARDRPLREGWRVYEGRVHANHETLWAEIPAANDPSAWPPVFRQLVIKAVAEACCMQHTSNRALKADLRQEAYGSAEDYPYGGLVAAATQLDSQADKGEEMTVGRGPLLEARD